MPILMTPGPVECCPRVLEAASRALIHHRGPEFHQLFEEIERKLNEFMGSSFTAIIAGTGTTAVDAACWSLVSRGERVLVLSFGEFGERMVDTLRRRGAEVIVLRAPLGDAPTLSEVLSHIDSYGPSTVALVHNETSTGVIVPYLSELASVCAERGIKLIVDAVSSALGAPIEMPRSGVWAIAYASHKAMAAPPGACFVSMSSEAAELLEKRQRVDDAPLLLDLARYLSYSKRLETPFTPSITVLYSVAEALKIIEEVGVSRYVDEHRARAEILYRELPQLGLEPLAKRIELRSPTVAAFTHPRASRIVELLRQRGYIVSRGIGELQERVVRIGVMGCITRENVEALIEEMRKIVSII